ATGNQVSKMGHARTPQSNIPEARARPLPAISGIGGRCFNIAGLAAAVKDSIAAAARCSESYIRRDTASAATNGILGSTSIMFSHGTIEIDGRMIAQAARNRG